MKKRHSPKQIVAKLRQTDVDLGKGMKVSEVCRRLGVSEQAYYRWRTKYGGMDPRMAKQMRFAPSFIAGGGFLCAVPTRGGR
ncbi:MAG: transposase [Planctomycetota bacterium]